MRQDVGAERQRLLRGQTGEGGSGQRSSLTGEQEQSLETFKANRKGELQTELKDKASNLGGPDRDALNAIGELFKAQKAKINALVEANRAERDNFLAGVRQQPKTAILATVDERIGKARARLESK